MKSGPKLSLWLNSFSELGSQAPPEFAGLLYTAVYTTQDSAVQTSLVMSGLVKREGVYYYSDTIDIMLQYIIL